MVVSAPDTDGRYYLLATLDMWTEAFAWVGAPRERKPGISSVVPAGLRPDLSAAQRYAAHRRARVEDVDHRPNPGPQDYNAVHEIQAGYKITPLSEWGRETGPVEVQFDPSVDTRTPPKKQVDTMQAAKYFAYAAEQLKVNRLHLTDQPIIVRMKRIGIDIPPPPKRTAGTRPPGRSECGNGPSTPTFPSASGGRSECASASPRISVPPRPPPSTLDPKLSYLKNLPFRKSSKWRLDC